MERKRTERHILIFLVIALVLEIALLAVHLSWGGFRLHAPDREAKIAGHVLRNENQLRRRGNNSLVWEKSSSDDTIYFYDSILTLAQSTASLQLDHDTEVKLSENTLVTIEPQEKKGSGEIRLKFVKGSLKARNPFATTKLEAETWSMEIKSGSDVDFRQVGENGFELEVNKGEVDFKSDAGANSKITGSELLRIQNGAPEKIRIDQAFRWIEPPPARIYTHRESERVKLRWQAAGARELVVQTLSEKEQVIALPEGSEGQTLDLPPGHHQVFLRTEGKTSPPLAFEIWHAPLFHLVSPLPRNRIRTGEPTVFLWMTAPGVSSYGFVFQGNTSRLHESASENTFSASFDREEDAEWSVEGKDADGFVIPPLYTYPIYIREAPLAAPKLRAPVLRQPAKSDGGAAYWWLRSFLPEAAADEILYQAVFNWEKVDGADRYVIEVSETADFRNPLVNKTVLKNEFIWKRMELKPYYWRVAAEAKNGRLGIFSDPDLIDLRNGSQAGVAVMPLQNPNPEPPPKKEKPPVIKLGSDPEEGASFSGNPLDDDKPRGTIEKAPEPVNLGHAEAAPAPPPIEKFEIHPHAFVEWRPGFSSLTVKAAENVNASLAGGNALSFAAGADRIYAAETMVRLQLNYVRQKFKAQPKDQYPQQGDLAWSEISGTAVLHKTSSHLGYGLFAEHGATLERNDSQSVKTRTTNFFGPCFQGIFQWGRIEYTSDYAAVIGTDYGLLTRQNVRVKLGDGMFYAGGGLEGSAIFKSAARASAFTGQLTFGVDF